MKKISDSDYEKLMQFLVSYETDISYWKSLDLDSVNHYTSGTPVFHTDKELGDYSSDLSDLISRIATSSYI